MQQPLRIAIIGVTGSVGKQAVDVIERNRNLFDVRFATAHRNISELQACGKRIGAAKLILTGDGMAELEQAIDNTELDMALVAAAGISIIPAAYKLAQKGIKLALANKECIVSAGKFIMEAAKASGGAIIPVDSEHSAIYQCLCGNRREDIAELVLTASGGAFRNLSKAELRNVTVEDALKNPNWAMGQKITVDSATMMNKGLELIEAHYLFDMPVDKLAVVIHPQSIVHSMVRYNDGAVIAQLAEPDMRLPIAYALGLATNGGRLKSGVKPLDFTKLNALTFAEPDLDKYPCLDIAMRVLKRGNSAEMIVMNAANECAVQAFINGQLPFNGIAAVVKRMLKQFAYTTEPDSIEAVMELNNAAYKATKNDIKG